MTYRMDLINSIDTEVNTAKGVKVRVKSKKSTIRRYRGTYTAKSGYTGFATVADAAQSGCVGRWENNNDD